MKCDSCGGGRYVYTTDHEYLCKACWEMYKKVRQKTYWYIPYELLIFIKEYLYCHKL